MLQVALKASDDLQLKQDLALKDHECETPKPDCMFTERNEEADVEGQHPVFVESERSCQKTRLRDCNVVLRRLSNRPVSN